MRSKQMRGAELYVQPPTAIEEVSNAASLLNEVRLRLAELRLAPSPTEQEFRDALDIAWISALRLSAEMNRQAGIARRRPRQTNTPD